MVLFFTFLNEATRKKNFLSILGNELLALARQALYHLSHAPVLLLLVSSARVSHFCLGSGNLNPPNPISQVVGITGVVPPHIAQATRKV
jgi:hypothetical protein